jgi:hypothetical protein
MTGRQKLMLAAWATVGLAGSSALGQTINYGTAGSTYFQDFDTLISATGTQNVTGTWVDNSTIPGWYAGSSPGTFPGVGGTLSPTSTSAHRANDGSSNSGSVYSYGTGGSGERALGTLGSGTPRTQWFGMWLTNTTGSVLEKFTLSYTGEQWRQTTGIQNTLQFYYSTTATQIYDADSQTVGSEWTASSTLDFNAIKFGAGVTTDGALDGNAAGNKLNISSTVAIPGGWQPGQNLFLRWRDVDNTGSDQGLAVDDLSFSAAALVINHNGTMLMANGSKTPAAVNLGRVVAGANTHSVNVTLTSTPGGTTYSDLSTDGASVSPVTGSVPAGAGTTVGVRISGATIAASSVGSDVARQVVIKNDGEDNDANVTVPVTAHVVTNRFVNNWDPNQLAGSSAAPVDFGKMLVGSTKTVTDVQLTTTNTSTFDYSPNALTTVQLLASTAPTGTTPNDAYASVTLGAGTEDVTFDGAEDLTTRSVTLTPLKSGLVKPQNAGGERSPSYLSVPLEQIDTAAGASGDSRVYVSGDFYHAAGVTGAASALGAGETSTTVTLTNTQAPSLDSTSGKRLGADILGTSFNQSGWSVSGLPSSIGGSRASHTVGGVNNPAVTPTVTGTISFSAAGKINGTYGATLSVALQNDQTQGVFGVAPNDLPATAVPVEATVASNPAVQAGAYTLNGGTLSAPATNLTGAFTQTGGSSTFASLIGGGAVTVSGGTLTLAPAATANVVSSLGITGTGKVDLTSGKLAINYTGGTPANAIRLALLAGSAGGWTGATGLTSSDAAAHVAQSYAIGYGEASLVLGPTGGTWNGATVDGTALLIRETYFGDANLDGRVNADDLALLDRGRAKNLTAGSARWTDGDFNYDGVVNTSDYLLADTAFGQNGGVLSEAFLSARAAEFGTEYVSALVVAVPEPTSLGLVGVVAAGLMGRRRRLAK